MSFLLRRTKRALAGWLDTFDRADENPIQKPWGQWGDARTVALSGHGIVLGNDGGWFQPNPNGGIGYEHMPLTPNWVLEFTRTVDGSEFWDGIHRVYIDKNWTAGVAQTRYQIYLELERDTEREEQEDGTVKTTVTRRLYFLARDTQGGWLSTSYGGSANLTQAEWGAALAIKLVAFGDSDFFVYINGTYRCSAYIPDIIYRPGPGRRAASFTQLSGPTIKVTRFATSDRPSLTRSWAQVFYDNFDRGTTETVGNGWSQGGGQFGILNNALSMQNPFFPPGDGYRGIWRGAIPSGNMRVEGTLGGGGTGDPNDLAPTVLLLRVNVAGTHALAAFIRRGRVEIGSINAAIGTPNPAAFIVGSFSPLPRLVANTHKIAFSVRENEAWVEDVGTGSILAYIDDADIHAPPTDTGYGAMVSRQPVFTNSAPLADLRAFSAA